MPEFRRTIVDSHRSPLPARAPDTARDALEAELDFGRYLRVFARHRLWLVCGALIGAVAGMTVSMTRPTRYEATTTVVAYPPAASSGNVGRGAVRALFENQTLASGVIEELGLNRPPHELTLHTFTTRALRIEEVAGSNLFKLRVQLADPRLAMEASRRLAQKAVAHNKHLAEEAGAILRDHLKPHVDDAAERVDAAARNLLAFRTQAQLEVLKADTDAMLGERSNLLNLSIEIESEKARLTSSEEELRKQQAALSVERARALADASTPFDGTTPPTRSAANDARMRSELSRDTPEGAAKPPAHPSSTPAAGSIAETLQLRIAATRARLAALERKRREIVNVRKLNGTDLQKLSTLYEREMELTRRQDAYDLAQRAYADVALRYEQARSESVAQRPSLQIVDEAVPPDKPLPRKRIQIVLLSILGGLMAAAVAALAWESLTGRQQGIAA